MRLELPEGSASVADIFWPPPVFQKQLVRVTMRRVPKAVAGACGAYQVATAKIFQAVYALCDLCNQLSSPAIIWQPQTSSTQAPPRSICSVRRGSWGTTWGLRHHSLTSIIVPENILRSQVDDLACDEASQTSRDGSNSPIALQARQDAPR